MSFKKLFLITFLLIFFLGSCGIEDAVAPHLNVKGSSGTSYNESRSSWQILKKEHGNSYEYTVMATSFSGHGNRTTMTIINGKVVKRNYHAFFMDPNTGEEEELDSYSENEANLGNHTEGAAPLTIDALYEICASEYLVVNEEENNIYFDTNGEGVMSLCGYVPNGCADDCFQGISMSHFAWL